MSKFGSQLFKEAYQKKKKKKKLFSSIATRPLIMRAMSRGLILRK